MPTMESRPLTLEAINKLTLINQARGERLERMSHRTRVLVSLILSLEESLAVDQASRVTIQALLDNLRNTLRRVGMSDESRISPCDP